MNVTIDREACIGCGACEAVCPEVFQIAEDGKSAITEKYRKNDPGKGEVGEELTTCVENAKESCPVEVIKT
jgi:ferredoxin